MGGFFGAVSKRDVVMDVFFGVDYHSHLGTRRAGMIVLDHEDGYQRRDSLYREHAVPHEIRGRHRALPRHERHRMHLATPTRSRCSCARIWAPSLSRPSVPSTMPRRLVEEYFEDHDAQFMALSSGAVNSTELVAALINQKDDLVAGIQYAQSKIDGSLTLLIMTEDGDIIAARDFMGRLPVLVGADDDGHCVCLRELCLSQAGLSRRVRAGPGGDRAAYARCH